jgi:hypothetical protein
VLLGALLAACAGVASSPRGAHPAVHGQGGPSDGATSRGEIADSTPRIDDMQTWTAIAATPNRELTARTEITKFVIDLSDGAVYFLQTHRWEIHYYFIRRYLARPGLPVPDSETFWRREYLSQDRRFVQGAVVRYRDQNVWAVEFVAQDVIDVPRAVQAFRAVRERVFFGNELRYHPVPAHHVAAIDTLRAQVPVVTTGEIFANTRYQPLNPGEAYGYLRFFDGPIDPARVRRYDVVVLAETPLDLPVCAGVITSELQAPLSHIAVLSGMRRTPNMALRGAVRDAQLRALEGQLVRLHVTPQEFTVARATQADAERAWASSRPAQDFHPRRSERDAGLPALAQIRLADLETVGAKAAQLGELAQIRPAIRLPRAFAVPFHAYLSHLQANGLDAALARMMADASFQSDPAVRERALADFRARVSAAPVDPALVRAVRAQIAAQLPGATGVRFRSSTNAEDLPGFNGAGLYSSARVGRDATEAQIADALRNVWASTWSFQGYEERAYYRIAQAEVAMAILVQESIDDDQVIGVAITGNPFDEGRPGYFINAQLSAGSVTSAGSGEVPEQLIFYTYPAPGALERVSTSSRTHGGQVLSDAEARALTDVLHQIQTHFYGESVGQTGQAMDVEYLFAGADRHVVTVQARPYTLHFNEGREWARPPE